MKLLNPGPVSLTERVRGALSRPDMCHREPKFGDLQDRVRDGLLNVYPEACKDFEAVLIMGSGTAAIEGMVGTLVPRSGRALVVAKGVYGDRMAAMLKAQGKAHEVLASAWDTPMDLEGVERALSANQGITHILAVHHETTSGRLNDLEGLGRLCKAHGKRLLVDAVSSFGGEWIDFDGWPVDGVAATANKCLHGVPGISLVLARRAALEAPSGATSVYLDLTKHWAAQKDRTVAFTPAVHVVNALDEALAELAAEGGWQARNQHYGELAGMVRQGLTEQGVEPLLADAVCSVVLRSF